MLWTLLAAGAFGQDGRKGEDHGLADNPRYATYARLADGLGFAIETQPKYQIAEGAAGLYDPDGELLGEVFTTKKPLGIDPAVIAHRLEQHVVFNPLDIEPLIDGFVLVLTEPVIDAIACQIAELADANPPGWAAYVASGHDLYYRLPPVAGQYLGVNLIDPNLSVHAFEMIQNGQVLGWMVRERRNLGVDGIEWMDHWLLVGDGTEGWKLLRDKDDRGEMVPHPLVFQSVAGFMMAHAGAANMYASAKYRYRPLGELLPNPHAACPL